MGNQTLFVVLAIGLLVALLVYSSCSLKCSTSEKYANRFSGPAYVNACEFNPACLWDTARTVQLSNGMEGVCTLNGVACPSFSKDHDRAQYVGLSPPMVDDIFDRKVNPQRWGLEIITPSEKEGYTEGPAGETALEMLL